jgi:enoyl-CoA hydratase/carnithine racemase
MTAYTSVLVRRDGSAGHIALNRPEARNPLDRLSATEMLAAFEAHMADPKVRCVVISGVGEAFCAGGDLRQMSQLGEIGAEQALDWPAPIVEIHRRMLDAPKPVIAAVDGPAFAGGMGLAGMCDIVLATRRARFAMPEVRLGLFPMIIVAHLSRSMPRKYLLEMMFTGEAIDADEAWRLGFVNRVVENRDELDALVTQYAQRFERVSPAAIRLGRRAFTLMADLPARQALDAAQFLNLPMFLGDDLREGASAFLQKRPPAWQPADATSTPDAHD